MCSYHSTSVWVAECPPFGKQLLTRLTILFSLYFDFVCNFSYFPRFGFESWIWVLIASVPGICILFTVRLCRASYRFSATSSIIYENVNHISDLLLRFCLREDAFYRLKA